MKIELATQTGVVAESMASAAECLFCQEMDELGWMLHAWSGVCH